MAAGQQIDGLITALEQSVDAGLAYFQGPGSQSKVKIGRWEPREVLCHLVWWHQATAEGMESVAAGGAPYRIHDHSIGDRENVAGSAKARRCERRVWQRDSDCKK